MKYKIIQVVSEVGFVTKNIKMNIILTINLIFYAVCDIKYLPIIVAEIVYSYFIYGKIKKNGTAKKLWLFCGIAVVIVVLGYFKYADFFLGDKSGSVRLLMPLGISYYSFKIISFLVDTYRGNQENNVTFVQYATYVSFFPQIMCGPISRADEIITQLNGNCKVTEKKMLEGLALILSGLFKKFVIADRIAIYTAAIFAQPDGYPALASWIAAFLFAVQIYCDFAGYSEIAIGVCNMLGFTCRANFNTPYFSSSIKEFWDRWHISLSTWLKDYIYIPLGGNRRGKARKNINLLFTFLVSGIWHGSGLNFICWGIYHGVLNMFPVKRSENKFILFIQTIGTFISVMFGWIMFNAKSFQAGLAYIVNMFTGFRVNISVIVDSILPFTGDYSCLSYFVVVSFFILMLFVLEWRNYAGKVKNQQKSLYIRSSFYLMAVLLFGIVGQSSFLYANF